jgi:hypothetical protein
VSNEIPPECHKVERQESLGDCGGRFKQIRPRPVSKTAQPQPNPVAGYLVLAPLDDTRKNSAHSTQQVT